jgi:hypothetical protein
MIDCKKVKTIPQINGSGTCWFNGLLMVFLYSQGLRLFFYDQLCAINTEDPKKKKLIEMFMNIYKEKYMRANITTMNNFVDELRPSEILHNLHNADKTIFYFNPLVNVMGFYGHFYSKQLLRYFDMHRKVLYCNSHPTKGKIWVSMDNIETIRTMEKQYNKHATDIYKNSCKHDKYLADLKRDTNFENIDVLFVRILTSVPNFFKDSGIRLPTGALLYEKKLQEDIEVGGSNYRLDGCMLSSLDPLDPNQRTGHSLAGVTCNGKRYLYNGWINPKTKLPCPLIEFDWFSNTEDFCIDTENCQFTKNPIQRTHTHEMYDNRYNNAKSSGYSIPNLKGFTKMQRNEFCFNAEHSQRTYTYVKNRPEGKRKFINLTKNDKGFINLTDSPRKNYKASTSKEDFINLTDSPKNYKASTSKEDFTNLTDSPRKNNKGKGKLI